MFDWTEIPNNHPVKQLFRNLTDRALTQTSLTDRDIHQYLSDLLLEMLYVESLYPHDEQGKRIEYLVDMLQWAEEAPRRQRKTHYKRIGDFTLFVLGMFPESLSRGRRAIPRSYYQDTGRHGYRMASELESDSGSTVVYRKMADKFDPCVRSLNWVREYTSDPFYQYVLREFRVM